MVFHLIQYNIYNENYSILIEAKWCIYTSVVWPSLVQIMACPWSAPGNYLNQCWNIVNWTLRIKLQWNLHRNSHIHFQENACENVVWKMMAILSQAQCVNGWIYTENMQHFDSNSMHSLCNTMIIFSHKTHFCEFKVWPMIKIYC